MSNYAALLRGINVGGKNKLAMQELVLLLEGLGLERVKSYIQSGNVVFSTRARNPAGLSKRIACAIEKHCNFAPRVVVLSRDQLEAAAANNPYPEAEAEPSTLHLFFLSQAPDSVDEAALEQLRAESERFEIRDCVFYLLAPEGLGRSRLATRAEKLLGVLATARNWRTVCKIRAMLKDLED